MKHPSSRGFFAYWDAQRGDARAPDRSDIEPGAVRELLGDIFVLSYDNEAAYPFRVAGTRVSALLGRDLKDTGFSTLFAPDARREIEDVISYVAEEMLPAIAGITAWPKTAALRIWNCCCCRSTTARMPRSALPDRWRRSKTTSARSAISG